MYCSACGVAVTQNLVYCNHCGARLNRNESTSDGLAMSEVRPDLLIVSMVATFIFGLLAITILMGVMKNVMGLPVERVLALMTLPFVLMLVLEGVFIRLLLRRRRVSDENTTLLNEHATNELDAARSRLLSEPKVSVTDHTTRAFEPIPRERKQN